MSTVLVSLRVKATPREAFDVFTREIGRWWQPSGLFPLTADGDGTLSFDGRNRLITTMPDGSVFEIGRVSTWVPGAQLAFTWRHASFAPDQVTYVDVRFEAVDDSDDTRVTVEHRGWDTIPAGHAARHGFPLAATQMRLAELWRTGLAAMARVRT